MEHLAFQTNPCCTVIEASDTHEVVAGRKG